MPDDPLAFHGHPRNVQYTAKLARLLNQTETGVARVLADESENFLERGYGRLVAAIDLNFTSDFYDVSEVIVETLQREFYSDLNRSVPESFEHALTVVNQTLADLAAEGQNDWVGKLDAIIGVIHENQIYLSQVGGARAYLVRGHNITHITEGLEDGEPGATAKTFLNVASGDLEVGDKLLFSSRELFYYLSENDIRRHLYLHYPARAIRKIADQMLGTGNPGRLAAVVAELSTIDLISAEPVASEPDEIVLAAPRRHFEALQRFKPFTSESPVGDYLGKAKKYWEKRVAPPISRTVNRARRRVTNLRARQSGTPPPPPPPQPAAGTPETERVARPAESTPPAQAAANQGRALAGRAGTELSRVGRALGVRLRRLWQASGINRHPTWRKAADRLAPLRARLGRLPVGRLLRGERKSLYRNLLIAVGLIFLISLFASVKAASDRKADDRVRGRIKAVEAEQAKAEASYIFKDLPGARSQVATAKREADALAKEKRLKTETAKLVSNINSSYDRIAGVIAVPAEATADFASIDQGNQPTHVAQSGTRLLAVGDTGGIYSFNQGNKEVSIASANPGLVGKVRSAATTSNGDLLLLTDKPTVFQFDATAAHTTEAQVSAGSSWESGNAIDTIQQTAFVLEPEKNQIWRHAQTLSAFGKGEPYLTAAADLKDAADLVAGAQLFLLKSDGSVSQFSGGTPQPNFKLTGLPGPEDTVAGANALAANFTTGALYVADPRGKRIIEYKVTGEYQRQWKSDPFGGVKDLAVDDKTNTLFVLAGGKVWQINLAG